MRGKAKNLLYISEISGNPGPSWAWRLGRRWDKIIRVGREGSKDDRVYKPRVLEYAKIGLECRCMLLLRFQDTILSVSPKALVLLYLRLPIALSTFLKGPRPSKISSTPRIMFKSGGKSRY